MSNQGSLKLYSLILAGAASFSMAACGGSSGGGGGASSEAKAAFAGIAALSIAQTGIDLADSADDDEPGVSKAYSSKATESIPCDSGSQTITDDVGSGPQGDKASPYHDGNFSRLRIEADNCRISTSAQGFSFSSRTNGKLNTGETNNGRVVYVVADNYFNKTKSSSFGTFETAFDGFMHICDGCANPQFNADQEMLAFIDMQLKTDEGPLNFAMGKGPKDLLSLRSSGVAGGAGEHYINGRMKTERPGKKNCSFDVTYTTEEPLITSSTYTDNETVESGLLQVKIAGGGSHTVAISGGVTSVDGVVYTEEDLAKFEDDCDFESIED